ncbi:MAG: Lipoprotein NlpD [Hydrocarboniphaga sp.]|uniref:peptidoglycan DD-metalloendopeptidase family protein n=1 Tax=Hydrocarboniphaga sp. TaxID=2033016 RepID=UPI002621E427|nr:peptidoglycan DD-metalloendopeptidase family protein [Hydrocarboniphaga sp.]MDB5968996.1 Lipoprotein NlpD [Hydrocarboniphaga sp.]
MRTLLRHLPLLLLPLLLSACASMVSWDPSASKAPQQTSYNPPPAAPAREPDPLPQRPYGPNDYLVRKGDTMYSIAFRNQVDYRDLARWNNIGSDNLIYPGQVLRLSATSPMAPRNGQITAQGVDLNDTDRPQALSTKPTPVIMGEPSPLSSAPVAVATVSPTATTPFIATPSGSGGQPGWRWPVDGTVVRGFNIDNGARGLDFTGNLGQPVVAASGGKVVYSGSALKGYGELVIIKHDDLRLSAYGYNQRRLVKEGDVVSAGQQIAELGIGPENKPLLHFEIRERGKPVNPVPYLPAR